MSYKKLSVQDFGEALLISEDLDPIYCALSRTTMPPKQLNTWLLVYMYFYDAGLACFLSEKYDQPEAFWDLFEKACYNDTPMPVIGGRWPRASERRHFRGGSSISTYEKLYVEYSHDPSEIMQRYVVDLISNSKKDSNGNMSYSDFAKGFGQLPLIGPWACFKMADIAERVLGLPIDFTNSEVFIFKDPTKAALMLWREYNGFDSKVMPKDTTAVITQIVANLKDYFKDYLAPPSGDRPVGLQEVETILCKWKSHRNGKYPLWNDIDEINFSLSRWFDLSETAKSFAENVPVKDWVKRDAIEQVLRASNT